MKSYAAYQTTDSSGTLPAGYDANSSFRANAGFTLIEIVIAIAIISIALVTLLSAMNRTVATAAESADITKSVLLAEEKLTMINPEYGESAEGPVSTGWLKDERYPTFTYKVDIEETQFDGASQVTVQVRGGGKNLFTLESYLIKK
ncbi:MAG: prepilin-type N-terminal cleavage/methylation domain-containing protein [Nitrospinota bacterium]